MLLMKLDADRANGTDHFINKFIDKVQSIFSGLPKPKDWISFHRNDLPLLFTASEVQRFALAHKLNKAQTKAIDALQKAAPEVFLEIVNAAPAEFGGRNPSYRGNMAHTAELPGENWGLRG